MKSGTYSSVVAEMAGAKPPISITLDFDRAVMLHKEITNLRVGGHISADMVLDDVLCALQDILE